VIIVAASLQAELFAPGTATTNPGNKSSALPTLFAACAVKARWNQLLAAPLSRHQTLEAAMGFGRGALLWLLGIPLPIILILALFMHR
jgi:hypothetical protein